MQWPVQQAARHSGVPLVLGVLGKWLCPPAAGSGSKPTPLLGDPQAVACPSLGVE